MTTPALSAPSRTAGSQTLARGLRALRLVAGASDGLSIQEVADYLNVHRTIAYRILNAICDAGLLVRSKDGNYRGATGLIELASGAFVGLRSVALPILTAVADELLCAVSLVVQEGTEAVALAVVEPRGVQYVISFAQGSRTSLDQGAAAHALRSLDAQSPSDSIAVREARERGYSITFAEVEPNMYGLAVPVVGLPDGTKVAVNIITNRREVVDSAVDAVVRAAARIAEGMCSDAADPGEAKGAANSK